MLGTLRLVKCWKKRKQRWLENEDVPVVTSVWEVSEDKVQWPVWPQTSAEVTAHRPVLLQNNPCSGKGKTQCFLWA